jgi:hypothetical protein
MKIILDKLNITLLLIAFTVSCGESNNLNESDLNDDIAEEPENQDGPTTKPNPKDKALAMDPNLVEILKKFGIMIKEKEDQIKDLNDTLNKVNEMKADDHLTPHGFFNPDIIRLAALDFVRERVKDDPESDFVKNRAALIGNLIFIFEKDMPGKLLHACYGDDVDEIKNECIPFYSDYLNGILGGKNL